MAIELSVPHRAEVVLPGALFVIRAWVPWSEATSRCCEIIAETYPAWRAQWSYGNGRRCIDAEHRMARFGDPGVTYSYKGRQKGLCPLSPALAGLRAGIVNELGGWFANCAVINSYGPASSLYPHADGRHIPQLGDRPTIAAASFGASRTLRLHGPTGAVDVRLGHGGLAVMHGACDSTYLHSIPPEPRAQGARVSVTFRRHLPGVA